MSAIIFPLGSVRVPLCHQLMALEKVVDATGWQELSRFLSIRIREAPPSSMLVFRPSDLVLIVNAAKACASDHNSPTIKLQEVVRDVARRRPNPDETFLSEKCAAEATPLNWPSNVGCTENRVNEVVGGAKAIREDVCWNRWGLFEERDVEMLLFHGPNLE